jgi:hypothetical protein
VINLIFETLLQLEFFKEVESYKRHHDLSKLLRLFGKQDHWEASIIIQLQMFDLLEYLELFLKSLHFFRKIELFDDHYLIIFNKTSIVGVKRGDIVQLANEN